jgi:hypothetical protein
MSEKLSDRIQETINRDSILSYFYVINNLILDIEALEMERDSLDKTIHNLMVVNGDALAKVTRLESLLTGIDSLLMDNYPCYDKDGCKNCSGEADEIDYKSCVGYNTLTVLRVGVE